MAQKHPTWLTNRINLLKGLMIRADLKKDLKEIVSNPMVADVKPDLLFDERYFLLTKRHQIPMDLYPVIATWVRQDFKLSDNDMIRILNSPVRIIAGKGTVTLIIRPNTKKSEIRNFINENINQIEALNNPTEGIEWMYPDSIAKRVDKPDIEGETALEMGNEGATSADVLEALGINDRVDESNMRRKKMKAKNKRTDVH